MVGTRTSQGWSKFTSCEALRASVLTIRRQSSVNLRLTRSTWKFVGSRARTIAFCWSHWPITSIQRLVASRSSQIAWPLRWRKKKIKYGSTWRRKVATVRASKANKRPRRALTSMLRTHRAAWWRWWRICMTRETMTWRERFQKVLQRQERASRFQAVLAQLLNNCHLSCEESKDRLITLFSCTWVFRVLINYKSRRDAMFELCIAHIN